MSTRLEILKRYLEEDPDDSFSRYALALEFISSDNLEESNLHLQLLLENDPSYLAGYYQLGKVLEKKGDYEKAKTIYLTGMELAKKQNQQRTFNELKEALRSLSDDDDE